MRHFFLSLSLSLTLSIASLAVASAQSGAMTTGEKIQKLWDNESPYKNFFSLRTGVNFSNYRDDIYYSDYQTGFNVAALYNISLMENLPLYLQTGVGLEMKGSRNNLILEGPEPSHFKSYGVQLPILLTFEVPLGAATALVPEFGLFYSFAFRGELETHDEYLRPYEKRSYYLAQDGEVETRLLHRSDFGIRAGLSFRYMRCLIGFAYDAGLVNSFTKDLRDLDYSMSTGSWSVNIGYRFN